MEYKISNPEPNRDIYQQCDFICTLFLQINPQTASEEKCLYTKEQSNPEKKKKDKQRERRIDQMESIM